ncbi:RHS repeat-associated core domain-containing protein, partial [Pseudomonas sp.]|uniref:RHS repeat-associated core domain-containing protein n=1 Tax=Pseudomonas sp. TaxID=306 RepID=UPI002EDA44A6
QIERWNNAVRSDLNWDLFGRLVHFRDPRLTVDFAYDPLGRRLYKLSKSHHKPRPEAGTGWNENEHARKERELGCGFTLYGWDGDNLAWESSPAQYADGRGRTVHYIHEPGTFVPVAQAIRHETIRLVSQPAYEGRYDFKEDPLWTYKPKALPIDVLAWYQCDHLGTPQELTDQNGNTAWSGQYKAWGKAQEQRSEFAQHVGLTNPIRFQGQYHDHETGLRYNRHRYYDPRIGRFISKDPIGYSGGLNPFQYAPNPTGWSDALGMTRSAHPAPKKSRSAEDVADEAFSKGRKSGAAAELRAGDQSITGVSGEVVPHNPQVTGALMGTPLERQAPWHGGCAEIVCLDKAFNAGIDPAGGTISTVNIGYSGKGHGTPKPACPTCVDVLTHFGVKV